MPSLLSKKKAKKASASRASPSLSPRELADRLLADPVANANLLPSLLALEAVPTDDVSSFLGIVKCRRRHQRRDIWFFFSPLPASGKPRPIELRASARR